MKILICSRDNEFASILSKRLRNDSHEIYLLTGEDVAKEVHSTKVFQKYDFSYSNENVVKIMSNIEVDVLIIAGRIDFDYNEGNSQKQTVEYITGVTNLILSAKTAKVKRVIYCSSLEIFEDNQETFLTKEIRPVASSFDKSALLQMDTFVNACRDEDILVDVIRFPTIYANYAKTVFSKDFLSRMVIDFLDKKSVEYIKGENHMALSVKDAVQVVISVMNSKNANELYHIEAEICSEEEIANEVINLNSKADIVTREAMHQNDKTEFPFVLLDADNDRLNFKPRYNIKSEVKDFYKNIKNDTVKVNKTNDNAKIRKIIRTLVETTIFSLAIFALEFFVATSNFGVEIDFSLIFVIVIAVIYGMSYAMYATVLATIAQLFFITNNVIASSATIDYQLFIQVLQLTVCGVIVGLMRDNYNRKNLDLVENNEYSQQQLADITRINESNMYVKNIYGKRITAYRNSLARLYNITSQLSFLDASKVIFQTAKVVSEFIETDHVAIYVSSKQSSFFRLSAATSEKGRTMGKSFELNEDVYFYDQLQNREIYMNREFNTEKPTYVSAVYNEDGSVDAIIMIWAMGLDQISLYQSSLIAVLSRLVEKTMVSALEYENVYFENSFIGDTRVMEIQAFKEKLEVYDNGAENGLMSYTILKLDTGMEKVTPLVLSIVEKLVRDTDFIGSDMYDVYILLASSDEKDTQYVLDRFMKNGINSMIVDKEEVMREKLRIDTSNVLRSNFG